MLSIHLNINNYTMISATNNWFYISRPWSWVGIAAVQWSPAAELTIWVCLLSVTVSDFELLLRNLVVHCKFLPNWFHHPCSGCAYLFLETMASEGRSGIERGIKNIAFEECGRHPHRQTCMTGYMPMIVSVLSMGLLGPINQDYSHWLYKQSRGMDDSIKRKPFVLLSVIVVGQATGSDWSLGYHFKVCQLVTLYITCLCALSILPLWVVVSWAEVTRWLVTWLYFSSFLLVALLVTLWISSPLLQAVWIQSG